MATPLSPPVDAWLAETEVQLAASRGELAACESQLAFSRAEQVAAARVRQRINGGLPGAEAEGRTLLGVPDLAQGPSVAGPLRLREGAATAMTAALERDVEAGRAAVADLERAREALDRLAFAVAAGSMARAAPPAWQGVDRPGPGVWEQRVHELTVAATAAMIRGRAQAGWLRRDLDAQPGDHPAAATPLRVLLMRLGGAVTAAGSPPESGQQAIPDTTRHRGALAAVSAGRVELADWLDARRGGVTAAELEAVRLADVRAEEVATPLAMQHDAAISGAVATGLASAEAATTMRTELEAAVTTFTGWRDRLQVLAAAVGSGANTGELADFVATVWPLIIEGARPPVTDGAAVRTLAAALQHVIDHDQNVLLSAIDNEHQERVWAREAEVRAGLLNAPPQIADTMAPLLERLRAQLARRPDKGALRLYPLLGGIPLLGPLDAGTDSGQASFINIFAGSGAGEPGDGVRRWTEVGLRRLDPWLQVLLGPSVGQYAWLGGVDVDQAVALLQAMITRHPFVPPHPGHGLHVDFALLGQAAAEVGPVFNPISYGSKLALRIEEDFAGRRRLGAAARYDRTWWERNYSLGIFAIPFLFAGGALIVRPATPPGFHGQVLGVALEIGSQADIFFHQSFAPIGGLGRFFLPAFRIRLVLIDPSNQSVVTALTWPLPGLHLGRVDIRRTRILEPLPMGVVYRLLRDLTYLPVRAAQQLTAATDLWRGAEDRLPRRIRDLLESTPNLAPTVPAVPPTPGRPWLHLALPAQALLALDRALEAMMQARRVHARALDDLLNASGDASTLERQATALIEASTLLTRAVASVLPATDRLRPYCAAPAATSMRKLGGLDSVLRQARNRVGGLDVDALDRVSAAVRWIGATADIDSERTLAAVGMAGRLAFGPRTTAVARATRSPEPATPSMAPGPRPRPRRPLAATVTALVARPSPQERRRLAIADLVDSRLSEWLLGVAGQDERSWDACGGFLWQAPIEARRSWLRDLVAAAIGGGPPLLRSEHSEALLELRRLPADRLSEVVGKLLGSSASGERNHHRGARLSPPDQRLDDAILDQARQRFGDLFVPTPQGALARIGAVRLGERMHRVAVQGLEAASFEAEEAQRTLDRLLEQRNSIQDALTRRAEIWIATRHEVRARRGELQRAELAATATPNPDTSRVAALRAELERAREREAAMARPLDLNTRLEMERRLNTLGPFLERAREAAQATASSALRHRAEADRTAARLEKLRNRFVRSPLWENEADHTPGRTAAGLAGLRNPLTRSRLWEMGAGGTPGSIGPPIRLPTKPSSNRSGPPGPPRTGTPTGPLTRDGHPPAF